MTQLDLPPDRLSVGMGTPFYDGKALRRGVEVYLNGIRQVNSVVEYCVSEGWIIRRAMTALGKVLKDELHQEIHTRLEGEVKVEWR